MQKYHIDYNGRLKQAETTGRHTEKQNKLINLTEQNKQKILMERKSKNTNKSS